MDRCINTLRNKVEPDPERPRLITTIRDVGYRFEVEWAGPRGANRYGTEAQ